MSKDDSLHGLNCPNCGGMIEIPEGQLLVRCPYCELRSFVRGERGLLRYQTPLRVERKSAIAAMRKFFSGNLSIARDLEKTATLEEAFVAYLPFWTAWARVSAWVFGERRVGSGNNRRYEPREVRVVQEMAWNGAACDVGEFGVAEVPLVQQDLQPFNSEVLHNSGMVFEPVGSFSDAQQTAENQFSQQVQKKAGLDRLAQVFLRLTRRRYALVYHPLWILRYLYRGRSFQVVVDGYSGDVLYGKAPGNLWYRAAILVAGMAAGAFMAVDVPAAMLYLASDSSDADGLFLFALFMLALGFGIMFAAYRAFRHGEQVEYRSGAPAKIAGMENPLTMVSSVTNIKDVEKWINQFN
jgi:DNA-directed RNA polymerase subunit RPC12/RpoP